MDYYDDKPEKKDRSWAATTSVSIGAVMTVGLFLAYLVKYFGHFLYGINIPLENNWAENAVIDAMINGVIQGVNSAIHAAGPVLEDFFRFFFSATIAWFFAVLAAVGFIFGIFGLKSEKIKLAIFGMLLSVAILIYSWWFISEIARM
jgi:hypothetical protein